MLHAQVRRGSVYTNTARFDGTARALTEDELRKHVPSIFATTAHESRSARFQPIPTFNILQGLQAEGFSVVGAKQSVTRIAGKENFTRHLLRLRRLDDETKYRAGDTVFEMLLRNANDGTSAYDLMAGLFRIACLNSLVSLSETISSVKVRHSGNERKVRDDVIEGTFKVLGESDLALAAPREWSALKLAREEQLVLAQAAHVVRFGETPEGENPVFNPEQLLIPRRWEDKKDDLWTVWNRTQEAVIKGGLHGVKVNANNVARRATTKAVTAIDSELRLNKALWILGEAFAKAKQASL